MGEHISGTQELLQRMHDRGLKLIVASSGEEIDGRSDVRQRRQKLKSGPVNVVLKKAKLSSDVVLMLGDTPYDIEAAEKCGVRTIAVRGGGRQDDQLASAVAIYDGPADLLAHYDESPLG